MVENEVILLKNSYDHIDNMVNLSLFDIQGKSPNCNIMFHDNPQRNLFFIHLVDFLSMTDKNSPIKQTSFLRGIAKICANPQFSVTDSEKELHTSIDRFIAWLEEKIEIDNWMPSINLKAKLSISRFDAIKICGNISKHNDLRSSGMASQLQKIMEESGITINNEHIYLALSDFYERFHEDILIYQSSQICEFLNNIRLAIRKYLQPEFNKSYHELIGNWPKYEYKVPASIKSVYARDCYWELMNKLRRKPLIPKFEVSKSFKCEY